MPPTQPFILVYRIWLSKCTLVSSKGINPIYSDRYMCVNSVHVWVPCSACRWPSQLWSCHGRSKGRQWRCHGTECPCCHWTGGTEGSLPSLLPAKGKGWVVSEWKCSLSTLLVKQLPLSWYLLTATFTRVTTFSSLRKLRCSFNCIKIYWLFSMYISWN